MTIREFGIAVLVVWLGFATFMMFNEYAGYRKRPQDHKLGNPLKVWWMYYLMPILLLFAYPFGWYENWQQRRKWEKEYQENGTLFWPLMSGHFKEQKALSVELFEVANTSGKQDPIDYALRWFLDTHLPGAMGVRVSEYVAIFQQHDRYYLLKFNGVDPLFLFSATVSVSGKIATKYPITDMIESYLRRHNVERFQLTTYP